LPLLWKKKSFDFYGRRFVFLWKMKRLECGGFAEKERRNTVLRERREESDLIESGFGNNREFKWIPLSDVISIKFVLGSAKIFFRKTLMMVLVHLTREVQLKFLNVSPTYAHIESTQKECSKDILRIYILFFMRILNNI
jgi:hypothetical protein